jgi:FMN-dependent oxidoreductase (nitrilotriacetate monooxygenase family)
MAGDLHLLVNVTGTGYHQAAWREDGQPTGAFVDVGYFEWIANLAERGLFDAILLPDIPFQNPGIAHAPTQALEPTLLLAGLAAGTSHIGLIPTVSSSHNAPYNLARRILSLDHASGGRAAWNVVTTFAQGAAANHGQQAPADRAARYRRAAEFVEVVIALWDSWEEDALVADQDSGEFARADRIHEIGHAGEFFDVTGPMNVPRSPQGRPVIAQAGASEPGIEFAARYAEVIYGSQLSLAGAIEFSSRIRALAAERGRDPDAIRILPGLVVVTGADEGEAWTRWRRLNRHLEDGRSETERLEAALWLEPGSLAEDLDAPIDPELFLTDAPRPQGFGRALNRFAAETGSSPRRLADSQLGGHRAVIGSPAQIADHIETWLGSGAVDGFTIVPPGLPLDLQRFVELVVPELQRRGIYRAEYPGATLRANLGLPVPASSLVA